MDSIYHIDLGLTDYNTVWQLQKRINSYKMSHKCADLLITNEHNHVYTLGKAGDRNHLLVNNTFLNEQGISYYEIDRGGDLTYHGPGQLVVYPIINLDRAKLSISDYITFLEEAMIKTTLTLTGT